jgi:immunity protein 53 of polymorphic toxin system
MSSILSWLQQWFAMQCDGEWEHSKGILIDTLDNPGWRVRIDIPKLEGRPDELIVDDRNGVDWAVCRIEQGVFNGYGAPSALERILREFKSYVDRFEPGGDRAKDGYRSSAQD